MADEKEVRLNRAKQDVRDRTGKSMDEVEALFAAGAPVRVLFDVMYEQIEILEQQAQAWDSANQSLETKADVADLRAQQYFVRLRDAGQLKDGEKY